MVPRRRFSVEYKREAVAMLESPGVSDFRAETVLLCAVKSEQGR